MPEDEKENEVFWGRCQVWGQGRFLSSKVVLIPAALAKRLGIQRGDQVIFKEDTNSRRIIIEPVRREGTK